MSSILSYSETMLTMQHGTDASSNPRSAFQPVSLGPQYAVHLREKDREQQWQTSITNSNE